MSIRFHILDSITWCLSFSDWLNPGHSVIMNNSYRMRSYYIRILMRHGFMLPFKYIESIFRTPVNYFYYKGNKNALKCRKKKSPYFYYHQHCFQHWSDYFPGASVCVCVCVCKTVTLYMQHSILFLKTLHYQHFSMFLHGDLSAINNTESV